MNLLELFCHVDDFCLQFMPIFEKQLLKVGGRNRSGRMSTSEIMTILIHFHQSGYRNFKRYYQEHVEKNLQDAFPKSVSYTRFVALTPRCLIPLIAFLKTTYGSCTGVSFIDSTPIAVCHNRRIPSNKVFLDFAKRGKGSLGWFYGFKLHIVVNERGELLATQLTPGNVDDRKPVPHLTETIWGKLFGDKGYISKTLFEELFEHDVQLITRLKKNMKNQLMLMEDKILLRKRAIIETINDQLKNISQIEHTRHRSPFNCFVNVVCGLIAYSFQPKKPSINLEFQPESPMLIQN